MQRWFFAIISLIATVASAERITTIAWDNGTNWPVGTTVELCANDLCVPGLTGTQHTMTVPVQPGGVISAKARAVAPAGYQCGNPLAPCPYSTWATLAQTFPAPPIGGWARYERVNEMAVTRTGSYIGIDANSNTGSQSISVPLDAEIIVCGVGGWNVYSNPDNTFVNGSITLGGNALSNAVSFNNGDGGILTSIFYRVNPLTGSQTLAWDWEGSSALVQGGKMYCAFYKGLDTSNPIKSSSAVGTPSVTSITSGTLAATTGDAIFVYYSIFDYNTNLSVTNATNLVTDLYLLHYSGIAEAFPSGNQTVTVTRTNGSDDWNGLSAIVLKQSTGSATTALPYDIISNKYTHILVR